MPKRMSVTPALRIFPSRASGALYRLTPSSRSIQLPPRSSGAPWCGEPRQTSLRQPRPPVVCRHLARVARAARHQPAHAVADDHQLVERRRPLGDELLEQRREARARWSRRAGRCCRGDRPACSRDRARARRRGRAPSAATADRSGRSRGPGRAACRRPRGRAARSACRSSCSGWPPWRSCIWIASGLPVAAR